MSLEKVLVTGGAGFIGSHLVDRLISEGYDVFAIDNLSRGKVENLNKEAHFFEQDIRDNLNGIFEENCFSYIFHFAAQANLRKSLNFPREDAEINVCGGLNILECCLVQNPQPKKLIFSSTGGAIYPVYGDLPYSENSPVLPISPYGVSKLSFETYLNCANFASELRSVCLRFSNVYGPRQDALNGGGVIAIFLNNILNNNKLKIFGDGTQTRDFVYVSDVIDASLLAMDNLPPGIFNVSSGRETSINNLAELIRGTLNISKMEVEYKPAIKGEVYRSCLLSDKIRKYGWKPKINLKQGILNTFEYVAQGIQIRESSI
jgi:UDP-glucose 4-epimerase